MHLGSSESAQEARVALGSRLVRLLRFFRAFQIPRVSITRYMHAKHEAILNCCAYACACARYCVGDENQALELSL